MIANLKARLSALCMLLVFCAGSAQAELVAVPKLATRVTDLTRTLTPDQQNRLEAKLSQFEQQKGSQIAILIVPTTEPEAIEQYAIRVVDEWKIGRSKEDDGLLILVAKNDRKMRIEVGYGLEGPIPDLTAKRIITEVMAPKFRQGDYFGGLNDATDVVMRLIDGEQLPAPAQSSKGNGGGISGMFPILLIGGLVLGGILRGMFGSFFGGALTGGAIGFVAWVLGGGLLLAIIFGIVAFFVTLMGAFGLGQLGGLSGLGGLGGGGRDIFSGGGGGFGGGGASGDW